MTYEISVNGPQQFTASTYHRWYTLGSSLPAGIYSWQIRATAASGLLASSWVTGPAFRIAAPARFYTVTPCRLLDTRNPGGPLGGPVLPPNGQRVFALAGSCGIPSSAVSVSANITVVPSTAGSIGVFPGNGSNAEAGYVSTSLSFPANKVRANNGLLTLSTDGAGSVLVLNNSSGPNHVLVDVNGYFQ